MAARNQINSERILQAAAEIMDAEGAGALTLHLLAQKLGIRSPSLYNHIEGLQDLRRRLSLKGLNLLHDKLMLAAVGRSGEEVIRELAKAYMDFARVHPGLYEATLLVTPEDADTEHTLVSQKLVDLVIQGLQAYRLKPDDAIHMARGLRSILHGFATLERQGGFGLPFDLDTSLRDTIEVFIAGLHVLYR